MYTAKANCFSRRANWLLMGVKYICSTTNKMFVVYYVFNLSKLNGFLFHFEYFTLPPKLSVGFLYIFLNVCPFDCIAFVVSGKVGCRLKQANWIAIVTPYDRR